MIEEIKEALQAILAPQIERIHGQIEGIHGKIEGLHGQIEGLRGQIEGFRGEMKAIEAGLEAKIDVLAGKVDSLDTKCMARFGAMDIQMEAGRREFVAEVRRIEETLSADFVRFETVCDPRLSVLEKRTN